MTPRHTTCCVIVVQVPGSRDKHKYTQQGRMTCTQHACIRCRYNQSPVDNQVKRALDLLHNSLHTIQLTILFLAT